MDAILVPLLGLLVRIIDLYIWAIVIAIIISWLVAFGVINTTNQFVYMVVDFFNRITEPAFRRIRRFMPDLGGFDVSPVILIFILWALQEVLIRVIYKIG
jgi:YggT family protein